MFCTFDKIENRIDMRIFYQIIYYYNHGTIGRINSTCYLKYKTNQNSKTNNFKCGYENLKLLLDKGHEGM
jgi:hypothetical protein